MTQLKTWSDKTYTQWYTCGNSYWLVRISCGHFFPNLHSLISCCYHVFGHGNWPTVHIQVSVWDPVKHLPTYHHMYRALHLRLGDCTFFSIMYGNLLWIDHMLGHKASVNKCQWIQLTQSMLFYQNGIKLKINSKMITSKSWFICKISSILLYNSYAKVKIMGMQKLNGN